MDGENTKFFPDSWFILLKNSLLHNDINYFIDLEYAIFSKGERKNAGSLGYSILAHVSHFTHFPFTSEPEFETVYLHKLTAEIVIKLM